MLEEMIANNLPAFTCLTRVNRVRSGKGHRKMEKSRVPNGTVLFFFFFFLYEFRARPSMAFDEYRSSSNVYRSVTNRSSFLLQLSFLTLIQLPSIQSREFDELETSDRNIFVPPENNPDSSKPIDRNSVETGRIIMCK